MDGVVVDSSVFDCEVEAVVEAVSSLFDCEVEAVSSVSVCEV